jgi:hypothetical protein
VPSPACKHGKHPRGKIQFRLFLTEACGALLVLGPGEKARLVTERTHLRDAFTATAGWWCIADPAQKDLYVHTHCA